MNVNAPSNRQFEKSKIMLVLHHYSQSTYKIGCHLIKRLATIPSLALVILSLAFSCNVAAATLKSSSNNKQNELKFLQAVQQAQAVDPWLTGNHHQQQALESLSIAANTLPDPKVSLGIANIAADSLSFQQEQMTQLKIGVSQMFPRGDTLALMSKQLQSQSKQYPYLRQDRQSQVAVIVGSLWLNAYQMQQSIALIEQNKSLFTQLIDVAEARYSSTIGQAQQQDIIRAELELSRIDDKLLQFTQQKNAYIGQLNQWLSSTEQSDLSSSAITDFNNPNIMLSPQLPEIALQQKALIMAKRQYSNAELMHYFSQHPSVIALNNKITSVTFEQAIAKQKYQPEWGVNASYGYRGDDALNNSRADLFSVGITFDVPLFTENKQDQQLKAAISKTEAVKTEKQLRLRQLLGAFSATKGRLTQLVKRKSLYEERLLPQFHQQADIALNAYTNDTGDFGDIVRARIDELNAAIDHLGIIVEQQKLHLELNYVFSKANKTQPRNQAKFVQQSQE
jgi:outer membrane protein TolC